MIVKKASLISSWAMWVSIASLTISSYVTWDSMRLNVRITEYVRAQGGGEVQSVRIDNEPHVSHTITAVDTSLPTLSGPVVLHAGNLMAETSDSDIQSEPQPFQLSTNGVRVERLSISKGIYHYRISIDTGMTHLRLDGYSRSSDVKVQFIHPDN